MIASLNSPPPNGRLSFKDDDFISAFEEAVIISLTRHIKEAAVVNSSETGQQHGSGGDRRLSAWRDEQHGGGQQRPSGARADKVEWVNQELANVIWSLATLSR